MFSAATRGRYYNSVSQVKSCGCCQQEHVQAHRIHFFLSFFLSFFLTKLLICKFSIDKKLELYGCKWITHKSLICPDWTLLCVSKIFILVLDWPWRRSPGWLWLSNVIRVCFFLWHYFFHLFKKILDNMTRCFLISVVTHASAIFE